VDSVTDNYHHAQGGISRAAPPIPERRMRYISVIITILILSVSSASALKTEKSYPDYEIQVSMYLKIINDEIPMTWITTVKIKDMVKKEYIKAWNTGDALLSLNLAGGGTLNAHNTIPNKSTKQLNFADAYKVLSSNVFKIAKKIQDAGKIPVIKFGKIESILTKTGTFYMPIESKPTGAYQ